MGRPKAILEWLGETGGSVGMGGETGGHSIVTEAGISVLAERTGSHLSCGSSYVGTLV